MEVTSSAWPATQPDDMFFDQAGSMHNMRTDPTLASTMSEQEALMQLSPVFDLNMNDAMDGVLNVDANPFVAGLPSGNSNIMGDDFLMRSPHSPAQDINDFFDLDYPHQFEAKRAANSEKQQISTDFLSSNTTRIPQQPLHIDTFVPFDASLDAPDSDLSWSLSSPESQRGSFMSDEGLLELSALDDALNGQTTLPEQKPIIAPANNLQSTKVHSTRKRKESPTAMASTVPASSTSQEQNSDAPAAQPRKRRTRRSKPLTEEQKQAKHERFLANNREAACKCRQKKKAAENKLVDDAKALEMQLEARRAELYRLQSEVQELKKEWAKHESCGSTAVDHRPSVTGPLEALTLDPSDSKKDFDDGEGEEKEDDEIPTPALTLSSSSSSDDAHDEPVRVTRARSLPLKFKAGGAK